MSYLHHADPLSIVELDGAAKHYLANCFLQLYSRVNHAPGLAPETIVDFYSCEGMYPGYPLISRSWLSAKTLKLFGMDVVAHLCKLLDAEIYIEALLDEYFISQKRTFQKMHFPHQNLIYGYSRSDQVFYVQSFDKNWSFSRFSLPFSEFIQAFDDSLGVLLISRGGSEDHNNWKPFSVELVKQFLQDFIEARCSFLSFKPAGSAFGVATYAAAVDMVAEKNGAQIDIRPWCVFHEHKTKLLSLCEYLATERGVAVGEAVLLDIKQLIGDFLAVRNYLLEANLTGSEVKISALKNNMRRITEVEPGVIAALIEAVDRVLTE